jgi:hypothetical protein
LKNSFVGLLSILALAFLSGCVTGRRTFTLVVPPAGTYPAPAVNGRIAIGAITDLRQFQNHPSDPSAPSIDGDVTQITAEARSTFIGRQRGGFGQAFGDVTLPAGETVQGKMAELLTEGLKRRGVAVVGASATPNLISAEIEEFWGWMTPGMWALSFEGKISCRVTLVENGRSVTFHVHGYGLNHGQFAKDVNWQQAYDETFQDFLKNLDLQLRDAGL